MDFNGKNILVMGLGISGISTIRVLDRLGSKIYINDIRDEEELKDILEEVKDIYLKKYLGEKEVDLSNINLIIKYKRLSELAKFFILI